VETVLGLSMTSTSVGWILVDRKKADGIPLDHDAFDTLADVAADADVSRHLAAVRGAQAIGASSGHQVCTIGVTWTDDVDAKAAALLKALPDWGFDNVVAVRLPQAAQQWARSVDRLLGAEKRSLCVIESTAVTVLSVPAGDDPVRTSVTRMRESADGLARWLAGVFDGSGFEPDSVHLLGSRGDLELTSPTLEEALPMPVVSSSDTQLALARGAALAVAKNAVTSRVSTTPAESAPASSRRRRPRFAHVGAVAALIVGAVALFAIGPEFTGQPQASQTAPAAESSVAVTSPISVSAALPATTRFASPPATVAPPPSQVPPRPLAADPPQPPAEPEAARTTEATVSAEVARVDTTPVLAAPATPAAVPQPPAATPVVASQEQIAVPPVVAPLAPVAVPAAAPSPAATPPPPAEPVVAPQDPVSAVLSPLFGALP
jgi:hypothetical protein